MAAAALTLRPLDDASISSMSLRSPPSLAFRLHDVPGGLLHPGPVVPCLQERLDGAASQKQRLRRKTAALPRFFGTVPGIANVS